MAQLLHNRARTTTEIRKQIQNSRKETIESLARKFNINPKTVSKWRKRNYTHDAPMGPKTAKSTVLKPEEEAAIALFRKQTLLPLDDCLYALKESIPFLTKVKSM